MIHHFIINPAAGKGTYVRNLTERITEVCTRLQVPFTLYETKGPGDASLYVRETLAADTERHRFYSCGGDGTLCETVNGAVNEPRCEYGLIPIGTGNDFCRNFDDRGAFFDIERQVKGEAIPIDLIRYNDRYCINIMNIGFDCNVVQSTNKLKKKWYIPSSMAYATGVAVTLFKKMTCQMKILLDGEEEIERPLLLTTIANGRYYGGGFLSNPRASLDDGLFDMNAIEKVSRVAFLTMIGSYKKGTHLEAYPQYITYRKASHMRMEFPQEIPICVDGEIEHAASLDIELVPKAAAFVLPHGVSCLSLGEIPLPDEEQAEPIAEGEPISESEPITETEAGSEEAPLGVGEVMS